VLRQLEFVRFRDPQGAIQRRKYVKEMGSVVNRAADSGRQGAERPPAPGDSLGCLRTSH
jgi:hypothetical protein